MHQQSMETSGLYYTFESKLVMKHYLATAAKNATYTSGDIQNQIISILGEYIRDLILKNVKKVPWFTVIADEVTDMANKQQLSLLVR